MHARRSWGSEEEKEGGVERMKVKREAGRREGERHDVRVARVGEARASIGRGLAGHVEGRPSPLSPLHLLLRFIFLFHSQLPHRFLLRPSPPRLLQVILK